MESKIRAGILSGIGLIAINILRGIYFIPNLNLSNAQLFGVIIQIGFFWFSISIWISLKYVLVNLNKQTDLNTSINWIISNWAIVGGVGIITIIFPIRGLNLITIIAGIILLINYVILFLKIDRLNKSDLKNINDLHRYILSIFIMFLIILFASIINEYIWHAEIKYLAYFLMVVPPIFLICYFKHEKLDIQNNINASA